MTLFCVRWDVKSQLLQNDPILCQVGREISTRSFIHRNSNAQPVAPLGYAARE